MKARMKILMVLALAGRLSAVEPTPESTFAWIDDTHPQAAILRTNGGKLIDVIGGNLMREVERALSTVGLDQSMEVMHLHKLMLPRRVEGRPNVTAFKLTSFRIRNPRNAPDAAELAALHHIRTQLKEGEAVNEPLLQKVERPGEPIEWRVYRPFVVTPQCLLCHGRADSLQPQIRHALNRHFPEDQAVDYGPYDWRGVIRISYELPPEKN